MAWARRRGRPCGREMRVLARLYDNRLPNAQRLVVVPRDSQGETVYEVQGEQQQDLPVVADVLLPPSPVKLPQPKYPKSLRKSHSSADVGVGVGAR